MDEQLPLWEDDGFEMAGGFACPIDPAEREMCDSCQ